MPLVPTPLRYLLVRITARTLFAILVCFTLVSGCIEEGVAYDSTCGSEEYVHLVKEWRNPNFYGNHTKCYEEECVEGELDFSPDWTYIIDLVVSDEETGDTLRHINSRGTYTFDCTESRFVEGRRRLYRILLGGLTLYDQITLDTTTLDIEYSWFGLRLGNDFFGFDHTNYMVFD